MKNNSLIAHWPLSGDANDTANNHHGTARNVSWGEGPNGNGAALFNGRDSVIEVADAPELQLGCDDFTISAWIKSHKPMRGALGDVLSKFDAQRRCGVNLWLNGGSSCYSSFSDARHVHFGIDDGYMSDWKECGRPGIGNPLVTAMSVYKGELYAGIADSPNPEDAARVYRWDGDQGWIDCGRIGDDPNVLSVMSMLVHDGHLYAGTGIWDWGRAEEHRDSTPPVYFTRVYRYEGGTEWCDLGAVGEGQRVHCLASFEGELYAGTDNQCRCFRLSGDGWIDCGQLDIYGKFGNFECLMPVNGELYGASHFEVYRYEGGQQWKSVGQQPFDITQIHAFQVFHNKLWIGTWPQGYILRYEGDEQWTNTGMVGIATDKPGVAQINEINALGVHNGKLYSGTIPKAQVYRYEHDGHWSLLDSLASRRDWDPEVCPSWMRILALLTHKGMLFTCTGTCQARHWDLDPDETAGRVLCAQVGAVASHGHDIGDAWTHIAAVRSGRNVQLYVNGKLSHQMDAPVGQHFHLGNAEPLLIGSGTQSSFDGAISDVRMYGAALDKQRISGLSRGGSDAP